MPEEELHWDQTALALLRYSMKLQGELISLRRFVVEAWLQSPEHRAAPESDLEATRKAIEASLDDAANQKFAQLLEWLETQNPGLAAQLDDRNIDDVLPKFGPE